MASNNYNQNGIQNNWTNTDNYVANNLWLYQQQQPVQPQQQFHYANLAAVTQQPLQQQALQQQAIPGYATWSPAQFPPQQHRQFDGSTNHVYSPLHALPPPPPPQSWTGISMIPQPQVQQLSQSVLPQYKAPKPPPPPPIHPPPTNEQRKNRKSSRNNKQDPELMAFGSKLKVKTINKIYKLKKYGGKEQLVLPQRNGGDEICIAYHCKGSCTGPCKRWASHQELNVEERERFLAFMQDLLTRPKSSKPKTLPKTTKDTEMMKELYTKKFKVSRDTETDPNTNALDTNFEGSKQTIDLVSSKIKSRKQLELVKAKLELAKQKKIAIEAREKLEGALKNRDLVRQQTINVPVLLPPVKGLSASLIVKDISKSGPEDMVYHYDPVQVLKAKYDSLILKNKGSLSIKDIDDEAKSDSTQIMTKEELERRKEEVQSQRDISYWRHFVSKQEHLLSNVQDQIQENVNAQQECTMNIDSCRKQMIETEERLCTLHMQRQAISKLISESSQNLLKMRQKQPLLEQQCKIKAEVR